MSKSSLGFLVLVLVSAAAVFGLAAAIADTPRPEDAIESTPPAPRPLSPMMQEIEAVLAADELAVKALQQDAKSAANEDEALRLLRAVHQQKQDTEIAILRIQERYALEAGDTETAAKIDAAIERILKPEPMPANLKARAASEARRTGGDGHE